MVNNNQQQEKPQDFELMELLFGKVDSSTSDSLDRSFEARYQSLVDQIQSYLHSSEKPGFFPHRFLGSFSSVLDTKLNDKLGIKKLHFRFEGARTLKIVAETESKIHVFIFTEDIEAQHSKSSDTHTRSFEFTKGEFKSVIGRDYNELDARKLQIDVIKILKDKYELVKSKPKSDKDVKSKKLHLYLKRDDMLEYKAKNVYGNVKTIEISRDQLKGKVFDEVKQFLGKQGKDLSDDARKELSRMTSEKGYTLKSDGEDAKINIKVESKSKIKDIPIPPPTEFPFKEVKKKLGQSTHLESYIEKLANPDTEIDQVQDNLKAILNYIKKIHTNLDLQGNVYGIKAREADQHGFVAGIFDNFRYRDNTKLYLEQFAGGGYADIVLLVRGPNRAVDSVPILIELKAGTEGQVDPSDALRQAEDYVKGFRANKMRILTNADNAIAVGLNLDNAEPFKTEVKPIKQPPAPLMEEFIELVGKWDNQSAYEEFFKREVKDLLSSEYYTFPANKETKDHYYFSRDILGQSILINKVGQDQSNIKKYIYSYGEYPLDWSGGTEYTLSKSPVTTLIFVQGNEGQEKTAFILHIRESNTKEFYADKKIPVLDIPGIGRVGNVIETKMSLKKYETGLSFEELFEIEQISKYKPSSADQQFAGSFFKILNSDELKGKLDQAITSQHASDGEVSLQAYKALLTEVADKIYPIKDLITNEARLQAVLNGLLSSYSDLKLKETSTKQQDSAKTVVIPEFQVGAGGRVDMVIQGIGPSSQGTKEYTPIALEFKLIDKNLDEEGMKKEVDKLTKEQNVRYAKGAALKAITDSDKMLFMGVVVNVKAKDKNSLILTSDTFVSATVVHSSIHMIHPDTVAQSLGKLNLNDCVGHSSRSKRSNNDCLFSKGDVEEFSKGKVDENNVDKVIIDSEKFLTYVKSSQDEGKNAQLIEFIGNKNIEGDYKYLVDKVVGDQGYERYIQNERIKDLQSDVLQQNSGLTKNPKLKSRLMNAAGGIQLIRGIHGAIVSCKDGTATDCGLNLGGVGWSFASQPIENVMVKITPRVVTSAEKVVGKIIPGTLGKQTKFVIRVAGVKFGSTVAKGVAGAVGGVFDIIDIGISANNLVDCKNRESSDNPCGEKEIRDNIASISFSGVSFVSGVALTAAGMPVVGIAVGFGLMVGYGVYSGISNIVEYEKKYDTTHGENWSIFWRTILFQDMASDVQHLADRKNTVDSLAKEVWKALNNAPNSVVAYGVGLGKVSDNTLRPDYAKILMDKEDTNTGDLSRVIPDRIPGASRICLPKVTGQDYEKDITHSVQRPLYYCKNAMVISHDGRDGKTIVYDLQNIDEGEIVGSNKWNNNFLIYPGTTKITGGNNVANRFVLVNNPSFLGKIIGGSNSINILDLSQLTENKVTGVIDYLFKPNAYGRLKVRINNRLLIDDYVSNNLFNYHYIGRQNKVDEVLCMGNSEHFTESDNPDVIIDSGGGLNRNRKDVVENCRKVIISPYTTVKGGKSNYTFYVKTADYKGKGLYSEINVDGTGTVVFPEIDLLSDCDQITYSKESNTLSLKINFGQNNQFTLDVKNYVEQSSNKPHFVLIDKNGSNIVPKIERSDSANIKINSFELHSEYSLGNFDDVETHYKKILNDDKDYKVLSVIRGKTQNQNDSEVPHMVFGSSGDDVINFDQGTIFARGGKGRDVYVITDYINNKEVKIDNSSDDEKIDTLFIPEVEKDFSIQQCDLYLKYNNSNIRVKNYFQDRNYRHLIIMNKKGEAFIPIIESISCSSSGKGKLVPFLQATQAQSMFLLSKDFEDDHVVIDSHLKDIEKYKDKDDLLLIREGEVRLIIRIEGFYNDQSKWRDVNFLLWNNGNFSQYLGLQQEVNGIIDYQDKLKGDYRKIIKEYNVDFTQSISITHNQDDTLTSLGNDEERIGVVILKNIAPDRIKVSSSGTDLIFHDKKSNRTVNIKGWNNSKSYRISTLEFDLGLEPITICRLDKFSLHEVGKIQSLIDIASENYQNKSKYTPKVETDFKCLISIDGFKSENRNPTYQCLGFSSLQDQIGFTEDSCSLEQLSEFGNKLNGTQISALSRTLQNNLLLSGYGQDVINQCSKLMMTEAGNQQSKISSMVKDVEESTFLGQSENKLDLGGCLSERKKRSSDFCPAFLENIHNELNREESERRNIVIEENSIPVITSDHETLDIEDLPIREVVINDNINRKRSLRNTLDLRKLVQQINEDLGIKPISMVIKDASDLLIKVSISATDLQQDVMTVRLKGALINKWYKKLQIIFNNAPMEIDDSLDLKPSLLISDKEIVVITPQDVEEKNKLVISKKAGQYAFLYSGYDLIVTNAFNANMELCIIYFKDFYKEPKMKTLSIRFTDKEILLSDEIDKIYNADSIDKLNYVSSVTNLQKSLITSLHLAAQNGDLDQVKLLFDNGGNIEAQDEFGKTPILCAAEAGKWSIVEFLLDNGANINNETTYQETPLHCAVQEGNLDIVKFLFDRGADIESKNAYNEKPLHLAIKAGRLDILKLLLDRGANINAKDKDGKTPLDVAKDQKHDVIIQYLEQAQLNEQLLAAVQDSDFSKVKDLINLGADVNIKDKDGKTPLHYVSRSDHHLGMVKYLISKGADIDVKDNSGRTPEDEERYTNSGTIRQVFMQAHLDKELLLTVKNEKDLKTISDLIVKDIDDRTHGGFYYTWSGNLGTVEFLVSKDVSVNATDKYGCTLLHWAALKGHSDIAKFLVDRGANVNAKDVLGRTPMHFAVMNNHKDIQDVYGRGSTYITVESNDEEIVQLFLMKEASINEVDKNGETPLHLASRGGHFGILQDLINNGANIGTKDSSGKTPLDIARDKGHNNIVQYLQQTQLTLDKQLLIAIGNNDLNKVIGLVNLGASLDAKDEYGWTSLHLAASQGYLEVTKFLVGKGTNINAKDKNGKTPQDIAIDQKHDSVAVYLQQTQLGLNEQLLVAVRSNDVNKVKDLVSKGASVDIKDSDGWTLLHHTARRGYLEVAEFLIEKGADINAEDKYGKKPIQRAAEDNNKNIITLLLSKGVNINDTDRNGRTSLYWATWNGNLDAVKYLVGKDASIQAGDKDGKTALDIARDKGYNDVVNYLEEELNKEREKPAQRKRRHHHGDHNSHHLSRKLRSIDSSNQPEIATSSGIRPSSWINDCISWVKSSIGKLLSSKSEGTASSLSQVDGQFAKASISNSSFTGTALPSDGTDKRQENGGFFRDNVDYVNANLKRMCERQAPVKFKPKDRNTILEMGDHYLSQVDFNGTITLFDLLIRRVTGQKYISTVDKSISPLEAQGYALNITNGFKKVVEQAALKSGISMHRLDIDYMGMQKEITRKVIRGQFNEISGVLSSYLEKACPSREAGCPGKLSSKKFDKFMVEFNSGLLNQSIEQILHNGDGRLEVDGVKEQKTNSGPQSYLSNAYVQGHSKDKVSTCLSEIGVTKLGVNLNR